MSKPKQNILATLNDEQLAKVHRKARRQRRAAAVVAIELYGKKGGSRGRA